MAQLNEKDKDVWNRPWLTALDVTEKGELLIGHSDGSIRLIRDWESNWKSVGKSQLLPAQEIGSINVLDKNTAFVNGDSGNVYLAKLGTEGELTTEEINVQGRHVALAKHTGQVFFLCGQAIRFGSVDTAIKTPDDLTSVSCHEEGETLAVSSDGKYVVVGGKKLQVMDSQYFDTIFEADLHLECRGLNINQAKNLSATNLVFLLGRGALIPPDSYLQGHFDLEAAQLDRKARTYQSGGTTKELSPETTVDGRRLQ